MAKYAIVKYYKCSKVSTFATSDNKDRANEVCSYMNEKMKDISQFVNFKVEEIK